MPFRWLVTQVLGLVQVSQVGARKLRFSAQDSTMNFHQVSKVAVQVQWACQGYQRDGVLSSSMGILGSSPQDELEGVWVLLFYLLSNKGVARQRGSEYTISFVLGQGAFQTLNLDDSWVY